MNSKIIWGLLTACCVLAHGCGDAGTEAAELATRTGTGGSGGDEGMMLDCESDFDCPIGEECEFEHGGSLCKPHGGDEDCDDDEHHDHDHDHDHDDHDHDHDYDDHDYDDDDDHSDHGGGHSGKG